MFYLIVRYIFRNHKISAKQVLYDVLKLYIEHTQQKDLPIMNILYETIIGTNIIGQFMREMIIDTQENVINHNNQAQSMSRLRLDDLNKKRAEYIKYLFYKGYKTDNIDLISTRRLYTKTRSIIQYSTKFKYLINIQTLQHSNSRHYIEVQTIANEYKATVERWNKKRFQYSEIPPKYKVIQKLYANVDRQNKYKYIKYIMYQVLQYIITLTSFQFDQEFKLRSQQDIDKFLLYSPKMMIKQDFIIISAILQHAEYSSINLQYMYFLIMDTNKLLKSNNIRADLIQYQNEYIYIYKNMFLNIENRLQFIELSQRIAIIHNVDEDFIISFNLEDDCNFSKLIKRLGDQLGHKEPLYDAIINGALTNSLEQLNMRSLMYNYCATSQKSYLYIPNSLENKNVDNKAKISQTLTLNYPQSLISLTVTNLNIVNINQCMNLKNLSSCSNKYKANNFVCLYKIQRLVSIDDEYDSNESLLHDVLNYSKLEFVYINRGTNIVSNQLYNKNLENLRVLHHCGKFQHQTDLQMDLNNCFPKRLQALQNIYYIDKDMKYTEAANTIIKCQEEDMRILLTKLQMFQDIVIPDVKWEYASSD